MAQSNNSNNVDTDSQKVEVVVQSPEGEVNIFGELSILVLRVSFSLLMVHHGLEKLNDPGGFAEFVVGKYFFEEDANSLANLQLSATSGTATNAAISSGTEIVGAGVASFNPRISATDSVTEIDIDLDATAGTYHVFEPNISAAIASKHLYLGAGSTCDTALTAFRGTLEIEYSVF